MYRPAPPGKSYTYSGCGRVMLSKSMTFTSAKLPVDEAAPLSDPEQVGGVGRQASDPLLDAPALAFADPVGEEERRLAGIHDLADVGAGIGEAERDERIVEHLLDRGEVLVEERHAADHVAVGLERQLDERGRRADAAGDGDRRQASARDRSRIGPRRRAAG